MIAISGHDGNRESRHDHPTLRAVSADPTWDRLRDPRERAKFGLVSRSIAALSGPWKNVGASNNTGRPLKAIHVLVREEGSHEHQQKTSE